MDILWKDRKRTFLGMPLSFTKYELSEKCLYIKTGVFTVVEDEVRLYRIIDVTLRRSFGQRLLGLGTIVCNSSDESMKSFEIKSIKKPRDVKNMLSDLVEEQRMKNRVYSREALAVDNGLDDGCDCHDGHDELDDAFESVDE